MSSTPPLSNELIEALEEIGNDDLIKSDESLAGVRKNLHLLTSHYHIVETALASLAEDA